VQIHFTLTLRISHLTHHFSHYIVIAHFLSFSRGRRAGCLCVKPGRRLSATEAMAHNWITNMTRDNSLSNSRLHTDIYRDNFKEERKMKKVGSRFNLIDDADVIMSSFESQKTKDTAGNLIVQLEEKDGAL
jgi:hypothetical protein